MATFRGKLSRDGQVVIDDIEVNLQEQTQGHLTSWNGNFFVPKEYPVNARDSFDIELDDGRSGRIQVMRVTIGMNPPSVAHFSVVGALK